MRIGVIGASGNVGSRVLAEARDRGHDVVPFTRQGAANRAAKEGVQWRDLDVFDVDAVAREIRPGERTGRFRVGGDQLLFDTSGRSWISYEDFAIAILDEIEWPRHIQRRFTVGY